MRKKMFKKTKKQGNNLNLNRASVMDLISQGIEEKTALLLIKQKPYAKPEDLLRLPQLRQQITINNFDKLLSAISRKSTQPVLTQLPDEREQYTHHSGIIYGIKKFKDGQQRIFLEHPLGVELISAGINGRQNEIDFSTVAILSHFVTELPYLDLQSRINGSYLLHTQLSLTAGLLWQDEFKTNLKPSVNKLFKEISEILFMLQQFTTPLKKRRFIKTATDGCTNVPDFNFKHCCDEHDRCYAKGGTEEDRLKCDLALYDCIRSVNIEPLAQLYFWGVRAFGASHFHYYFQEIPTPAESTKPPLQSSDEKCTVKIYLIRVDYRGDNIGNAWSYILKIQDCNVVTIGEHAVENKTIDTTINKKLLCETSTKCGEDITLSFAVSATEHDSGFNDSGTDAMSFSFKCDGSTYSPEITVNVSEWLEGTAQMVFKFHVETKCE